MCYEFSSYVSYATTQDTQQVQSKIVWLQEHGQEPPGYPNDRWQAGQLKTEQLLKHAESCEM